YHFDPRSRGGGTPLLNRCILLPTRAANISRAVRTSFRGHGHGVFSPSADRPCPIRKQSCRNDRLCVERLLLPSDGLFRHLVAREAAAPHLVAGGRGAILRRL